MKNLIKIVFLFNTCCLLVGQTKESVASVSTQIFRKIQEYFFPSPPVVPIKFVWNKDDRPRIIICSSIGGGGHTAAANAIKSYLGNNYQVSVVNIISELLPQIDPFYRYDKKFAGEKMYDYFLQKQFTRSAEFLSYFGKISTHVTAPIIEQHLESFLLKNKPDALLSVLPFFNGALYRVTQKLHIPFAIIATDLDPTNYYHDLQVKNCNNFYFCLNFNEPEIRSKIPAHIPSSCIQYVGFPVQIEFLNKRYSLEKNPSVNQIKQEFAIPLHKKIVMVLMGAAGSQNLIEIAQELRHVAIPIHIIFLMGKNEFLRQPLESIAFPSHISISTLSFTSRIADLMSASNLLITKSGPTSICEALYVGIPLIIDQTKKNLWWEQLNIDFVKKHEFGIVLQDLKSLPSTVENLLSDKLLLQKMRQKLKQFPLPSVNQNIRNIVKKMTSHPIAIPKSS